MRGESAFFPFHCNMTLFSLVHDENETLVFVKQQLNGKKTLKNECFA